MKRLIITVMIVLMMVYQANGAIWNDDYPTEKSTCPYAGCESDEQSTGEYR